MAALKKALDDCLIDFDSRVLVTDLLEQYKLTYKEVHETLEAHIKQQEQQDSAANKYEKRYLVHGTKSEANGTTSELYTIVQGESKLNEWLRKLQNAESTLYSVEVSGGSKTAAAIFKPMQHIEVKLATLTKRVASPVAKSAAPVTNGVHKPATATAEPAKQIKATTTNIKTEVAATEVKKDVTPPEQKGTTAAPKKTQAVAKKGTINSFFTAGAAAKKQPALPVGNEKESKPIAAKEKETKTSIKSVSGSIEKQMATQAKKSPVTSPANTSVQLFLEDSASSDEEEKMDKLRRAVVNSDNESDADDDKPSSSKRRRIVDSDDEEQPQKKTTDAQPTAAADDDDVEIMQPKSETYMDEDGFIVTIKAKKPAQTLVKKRTSPTAAAKRKTPPKATKGSSKPSTTPAAAAKTKQGSIMSFFTKK